MKGWKLLLNLFSFSAEGRRIIVAMPFARAWRYKLTVVALKISWSASSSEPKGKLNKAHPWRVSSIASFLSTTIIAYLA
jgi:hypothetical protein